MKFELQILPSAQEDIVAAVKWYNDIRKPLADSIKEELKANILFIRQNPLLFQIRYNKFRAAILKRFPYLIYYMVDDSTITIIALLAAKQDQFERLNI